MRLLWSLPKAAPVLLRHIAAYVELACLDLAQTKRELQAELAASVVAGICVIFGLLLGCILVIAWTWDTPNRIAAIAWMMAGFLAVAVAAGFYRAQVIKHKSELLAAVRQQWVEDRVLLERILSDED